jgi:hypothetical protein
MHLHLAGSEVLAGRERVLARPRLDDGAARDERAERTPRGAALAGRDVAAREQVVEGEGAASVPSERHDEPRAERVLVVACRRRFRVVAARGQAAAGAPAWSRMAGAP